MKIYYGWIIVAISIAIYILVIGATYSSFSIFVIPVSSELQLSRAEMNTTMILIGAGNALLAPFFGRMLDRFAARSILIGGAILLGASFLALSFSESAWLSAAVVGVPLAAGYLCAGSLTMTVLIARWFVVQRGRAMALSTMGMSLATIVVPPLVGLLVESHGWRGTLVMVAGTLTALLVLLALFIRERPGVDDIETGHLAQQSATPVASEGPDAGPGRVADIVRMPQFWMLGCSVAAALGVLQALSISILPLALQGGLTMLQATSLVSLLGAGSFVGMMLFAIVADRIDRVALLVGLFCAVAILNAALLAGGSYGLLALCAAALGVASGPITPAFYALIADRFGAASFGTVRGLMVPLFAIIGMAAIRLAGEVFDRTGGYDLMFVIFIGALVVAGLVLSYERRRHRATASPQQAVA